MSAPGRPIITVTLNPALDVSTTVDRIVPDAKLRGTASLREPGGGGINVARVASRLNADVSAIAVVGGATGQELISLTRAEGLTIEPVLVDTDTRECFAVWESATERQYRFVLPGPEIDASVIDSVAAAVQSVSQKSGTTGKPVVVVSGSMPRGTPAGAMTNLVASLPDCDIVIDTGGPALTEALDSPALLVKPSARELAAVVDRQLETEADVLAALVEIFDDAKAEAVLVSIGAGGAILATADAEPVRLRAPAVQVRSTVGAGDSMVGGVVVGLASGHSLSDAAKLGVAAGTATVLSDGSGLCAPADIERLLPLVSVST